MDAGLNVDGKMERMPQIMVNKKVYQGKKTG